MLAVNGREPEARQRFTLFHEYKHVVDHGRTGLLYRGTPGRSPEQQAEQAADYFAGCVLMPKRLVKLAWGNGIQAPAVLAALFDVSERAAEVRLAQLGLSERAVRCAPPGRSNPRSGLRLYYRIGSLNESLWRAA